MPADRRRIVFPPYRLDLEEERLWRGPDEVSLKPKVFAMLRYLATNPRRLISKRELLAEVWDDSHVSPATVRGALRELRAALGESEGAAPIIETVHGRGYRFLAGEPAEDETENEAPPPPQTPVLFGRHAALHDLRGWLADAMGGRRAIGFVTGEPGIGKTSLVETLQAELEQDDVLCARGQCISGHGGDEPYRPLLEALTRLGRHARGRSVVDLLRRHAPTWLIELPGLLESRDRRGLEASTFRINQERMLRELADALEAICEREPVALFLEDLHWSDRATLDAIELLARRTEPARLLIVATHRPVTRRPDDETATRLAEMRAELHLHRLCSDLALPALSSADTRAYLGGRYPGVHELDALADFVFDRSEGNPLLMVSFSDEIERHGTIEQREGAWHFAPPSEMPEVPFGVRAMIEHQIDQLPSEEEQALEAASVAGVEIDADAVVTAFAPALPGIDRSLGRLAREHGLLEKRRAGSLRFRHALHQEIAYARLPDGRKKELHLRLGEHLEQQHQGRVYPRAAELSMHFDHGGDHARSARYAVQAADAAFARSAHAEAVALLRRAQPLLPTLPDGAERRRLEFVVPAKLGQSLAATKGYTDPEVRDAYHLAHERASKLTDTAPELVSVLAGLCGFHELRGEHAAAYDVARQERALADRSSDPYDLVVASVSMSIVLQSMGRYEEADRHIESALTHFDPEQHDITTRPHLNDLGVHALAHRSLLHANAGRLEEAQEAAAAARARARKLGHIPSIILADFYTMMFHSGCRDLDATEAAATACLELSMAHGFPFYIPITFVISGSTKARQGNPEEGIPLLEQGIALLDSVGARLGLPLYLALRAEARGLAGDFDAGLADVAHGFEVAHETEEYPGRVELHYVKGKLLSWKARSTGGDDAGLGENEKAFGDAIALGRQSASISSILEPAVELARLWQASGRAEEAKALLDGACAPFSETADAAILSEARALRVELA